MRVERMRDSISEVMDLNLSQRNKTKVEKQDVQKMVKNLDLSDSHKTETREMTDEEVFEMVEKANDEFAVYDRRFEFSVHEATNKVSVKVLDSITDEVIREIPPEKILDMLAGIWELAGILIDEKI